MKQIDEAHLEQDKFYVVAYTCTTTNSRRYEEVWLDERGDIVTEVMGYQDKFFDWGECPVPKDITFWEMV